MHADITSRLDNCNSLLINASKANLYELQKVQNAAARLVVRGKKRSPNNQTLKDLHCLKVDPRIVFKILPFMFKAIHGQCSKI